MLTCKEITELVTDYLEGRLSFGRRLSFLMHVGRCKDCRAYLRQMRVTVRTLGELPNEPMPANVRDELVARFRNARPRRDARAGVAPWTAGLLAAVEKAIGKRRGWLVAGLVLASALGAALVSGVRHGPLGDGSRCLLVELDSGAVPLVLLGLLAFAGKERLSMATFAAAAMLGSLVGFGVLEATCPLPHGAEHVAVFHLGGMVLAGLMGVAAGALRSRRFAP